MSVIISNQDEDLVNDMMDLKVSEGDSHSSTLPGKPYGWRSLVGCSPWGCEESDTIEQLHFSLFTFMHWRRKWQPTPLFLPGESQG